MATAEMIELMTAEEFGKRPDPGYPEELIRGRIVAMSVPDKRHGYVCLKVGRILGDFVDEHDLGRVMSNDSGVITEREPDTVRGADVSYYSFNRLPKGPLAPGYGNEIPELVVEVRSPGDRWRDIQKKVAEYLEAGVLTVVVLDPESDSARFSTPTTLPRTLGARAQIGSSRDSRGLPHVPRAFL